MDLAERQRGLRQSSEGQDAREVARRRHDDREYRCHLAISSREEGEPALRLHQPPPGPPDVPERRLQLQLLVGFTARERDAFRVFAYADHAKPELRVVALQVEVDADQRPANEVGRDGPQRRVEDGHPHHVAWDHDRKAWKPQGQRAGQEPEQHHERSQSRQGVEDTGQ